MIMIKLFMLKFSILLLTVVPTVQIFAQPVRPLIRDKLEIYFIANGNLPKTVANNVIKLNNIEIYSNKFTGAFWTNRALAGSHAMVKALLCDKSNGGDSSLQVWSRRLLSITNKTVKMYLIDDFTNPITDWVKAWKEYQACKGTNGCWPCALGYAANPSTSDLSGAGQLTMGNNYFSNYNEGGSIGINTFKKGVFLHELTHTQDNSYSNAYFFSEGGKNYNYGTDGSHYYEEVVPNLAAGFKESLATLPQMGYDRSNSSMYFRAMKTFATDGGLLVEAAPSGIKTSDITFANELLALKLPKKDVTLKGFKYYQYSYKDIPITYIIRNELIMGLIFYNCRLYLGATDFWKAFGESNTALDRVSSWPVDVTFSELCKVSLPDGMEPTVEGLSVSNPGGYSYFLPLALCDFFTSFRAKDENEFNSIFENSGYLEPYVSAYWALRPIIKTAAGNKKDQAAIEKIVKSLGIL